MRWRILALVFLARVGTGLQFQTLGSVGDDLVVAFGLDHATIGLMIGLFMAPGLFLAVPAGYFGRFASDRALAGAGLSALSLGGFVCGFSDTSWTIGLGRIVSGAGFLIINLYFTKMVADWFAGREIATAMSILVTSWPIGIAIGQSGHAWLAASFGWTAPFLAASAYCGVAAICVSLLYRTPDGAHEASTTGGRALLVNEWRLVILAGGAWGFYNSGYVIYLSFAPRLLEAQGYSALAAAGVISVASWLTIASFALCGYAADRFGGENRIIGLCMLSAIVSLGLLSVPGAGLVSAVLFGLVGFAPAGVLMALAGKAMRPEQRAFGMGVFFSVYFAVMMSAPPLAGAAMDLTGTAFGPIWVGMALFAAVVPTTLAFHWLKSSESRPKPEQT